jgi:hypothetical protein
MAAMAAVLEDLVRQVLHQLAPVWLLRLSLIVPGMEQLEEQGRQLLPVVQVVLLLQLILSRPVAVVAVVG